MAGFRSLRQRMAGPPDPDEVLPLNVPLHMRQPLSDWLVEACSQRVMGEDVWPLLCQMLRIDYTGSYSARAALAAANEDNDLWLELIDARLKLGSTEEFDDSLARSLFLGGSGWQLNDEHDGLEQVVDETVREAARDAIDKAEVSAAEHLRKAWSATHGRNHNPTLAHTEMIRAVESAARPVLTPNDPLATLGKLIGQLNGQAALYTTSGASAANDGVAAGDDDAGALADTNRPARGQPDHPCHAGAGRVPHAHRRRRGARLLDWCRS